MENFGRWIKTPAGRDRLGQLRSHGGGLVSLVFVREGVFSARWDGTRLVLRLLRRHG
jgi:hypothetical protein